MVPAVQHTNSGFSLLETVIATLLLTVMMLWSVQGMITAYNYTGRNQLRDEGVRLAGEALTDARNTPYISLSSGTTTKTVARQIRSYDLNYTVDQVVVSEIANLAYSVEITVKWQHKGKNYQYQVATIVGDK